MPLAEDQYPVSDLGPGGEHEPFGISVRSRRPDRRLDHPRAVPREDLIEGRRELAVPVAEQELEAARRSIRKLRATCVVQAPSGLAVMPAR